MTVDEKRARPGIGVYAHIPWCASKCPYCDFNSRAAGEVPEKRYTDCLTAELRRVAASEGLAGRRLSSLYFGGGTPTLFSPGSIGRVIDTTFEVFTPAPATEVTVEANPGTVTVEKLRALRASGVNRLSLGVQSTLARDLTALGRAHSAREGVEAVGMARRAGFENVGVDIIFAVPGQTARHWKEVLDAVAGLAPEHLSLYGLTIEEATPFGRIYGGPGPGRRGLASEEDEARMYELALETLGRAGYVQYEVSNFALPGRESVHNSGYWLGRDYLGLGAGAHSYRSSPPWGRRTWNVEDPGDYMDRTASGLGAEAGGEDLTRGEAMAETVMLGLRMCGTGVDDAAFNARYGVTLEEALAPGLPPLVAGGLVSFVPGPGRLCLSRAGLLLDDSVIAALLAGLPLHSAAGPRGAARAGPGWQKS